MRPGQVWRGPDGTRYLAVDYGDGVPVLVSQHGVHVPAGQLDGAWRLELEAPRDQR